MRQIWTALCLILALAGPARADEAAIRGVISNQIAAFQADDFARAFTFASPMIQGIFGTPDRFGVMVREGYPMVWRPGSVRFLDIETRDGALWQGVLIEDQAGRLHILDYQMIETSAGWKINAVHLRAPPAGTV